MYRLIDFKRRKDGVWAQVVAIEYDPNRSSRIALLQYEDGERRYILAPEGLKAGDRIISGEEVEPRVRQLFAAAAYSPGHDDPQPGNAARPGRSDLPQCRHQRDTHGPRGTLGPDHAASGEVRRVCSECRATIGSIGNADHMNVSLGKAGRKRWMAVSRTTAARR